MRKRKLEGDQKKSNVGLARIEQTTGKAITFTSKTHESCWGSHWHAKFGWGYKCCFSHNMDDPKCGGEAAKLRQIQLYKGPEEKQPPAQASPNEEIEKPSEIEEVES